MHSLYEVQKWSHNGGGRALSVHTLDEAQIELDRICQQLQKVQQFYTKFVDLTKICKFYLDHFFLCGEYLCKYKEENFLM